MPLRTRWVHGPACRSHRHTNHCAGGNWGLHRATSPPTGLGLLPTTTACPVNSAFGPHSQVRVEIVPNARQCENGSADLHPLDEDSTLACQLHDFHDFHGSLAVGEHDEFLLVPFVGPQSKTESTFWEVDPHDVWLGPQHQLAAYDAAWTFTPKKLLLAAYAVPHSRAQLSKLRQEKEKRGKGDPLCWSGDDSCSARSYRVCGLQHHLSLPKPV